MTVHEITLDILTDTAPTPKGSYSLLETYASIHEVRGALGGSMARDLVETISGIYGISDDEAGSVVGLLSGTFASLKDLGALQGA